MTFLSSIVRRYDIFYAVNRQVSIYLKKLWLRDLANSFVQNEIQDTAHTCIKLHWLLHYIFKKNNVILKVMNIKNIGVIFFYEQVGIFLFVII